MKRSFCIASILMILLVQSGTILGMHYHSNGSKPSLILPTGHWEEADRESVAEQLTLEREEKAKIALKKTVLEKITQLKPTITITNKGIIPFTAQTSQWTCTIPAGETSQEEPCSTETFLEVIACNKSVRCLVQDAFGLPEDNKSFSAKKNLTIVIFSSPESDDISAIFNNSLALSLAAVASLSTPSPRNNNQESESDTSETTHPFSVDSPVASPHALPRNNQDLLDA